jgi:hypothetical protein
VRLDAPESPAEIYLKLENLQPIRSFKIRGATNAVRQAQPEEIAQGVLEVTKIHQVIGEVLEDVIGVEGRNFLGAIPL